MMPHQIIIRADANRQMGTGHIMRCLALAQALKKYGIHSTFISNCSPVLQRKIISTGFDVLPLDLNFPDPSDIRVTTGQIQKKLARWVILDGYRFTEEYNRQLKDQGVKILMIDDYRHLPFYHADILLNQNLDAENLNYKCPPETILLTGAEYILLRDEFLDFKPRPALPPKTARNLLITMGGSDPKNATLKVIQAIMELKYHSLFLTIVLGPENDRSNAIKHALESAGCHYELVINTSDMPGLMDTADMAIAAGGSTAWELSYMGVPTIYIITADNQAGIVSAIDRHQMGMSAGQIEKIETSGLSHMIQSLIHHKEARERFSKISQGKVNGSGSQKVARCIYNDFLSVSQEDDPTLNSRNDNNESFQN